MLTPKFSAPGASFIIQGIMTDGDFAAIHLHARLDPESCGLAVVDIYRLHGGKIVEHWDVLQAVPAESKNAHPMF